MPRWTVTTRDGIEDIGADALEVIDGALVFTANVVTHGALVTRELTVAYAPTTWTNVTRDED